MKEHQVSTPWTLTYHSDDMDLLQIGILNKSLHDLLNQVAITLIDEENRALEASGEPPVMEIIPTSFSRTDILIRTRLTGVRPGSIILDLQPYIIAAVSSPAAIAILQNLVSNAIWAIGEFGVRVAGVKITKTGRSKAMGALQSTSGRRKLSTKVSHLVKDIKEAGNGGKITIKSGDEEMIIELYAPKKRIETIDLDDE